MRNLSQQNRIHISLCLAAQLSLLLGQVAAAAPQQEVPVQPAQAVRPQQQRMSARQDNPAGTSDAAPAIATTSGSRGLVSSQNTGQNQTPGTSESSTQAQQSGARKPVGTAAAPYEKTTGVAASRPAGAVIAPAKQRRVRSFLIKIGVVVGAGVALGTVAALSHASPSHPR